MKNISTTQTTNYVAIAGLIVMILNHFGIQVANEEVTSIVGAVLTLTGILWNFFHRYSYGDLNLVGTRK